MRPDYLTPKSVNEKNSPAISVSFGEKFYDKSCLALLLFKYEVLHTVLYAENKMQKNFPFHQNLSL